MATAIDRIHLPFGCLTHDQLGSRVLDCWRESDISDSLAPDPDWQAFSSQFSCLSQLGLSSPQMEQMSDWAAQSRTVTLAFRCTRNCSFNRKVVR